MNSVWHIVAYCSSKFCITVC